MIGESSSLEGEDGETDGVVLGTPCFYGVLNDESYSMFASYYFLDHK